MNLLLSVGSVLTYVLYIVIAVLILLVMITVHEFGHYVAGKIFKFGITEFAIGFGPKIYSKTRKNGEIFSVRLLPLGGFCSFIGEDENNSDPSAFNNKKPWQRFIVLISGALMNFVLALAVIVFMFAFYGQTLLVAYETVGADPEVTSEFCFQDKDVIVKIENRNVYMTTNLIQALDGKSQGEEVVFTVLRGGRIQDVRIKLRCDARFANLEDVDMLYSSLGIKKDGIYSTRIKLGFFSTLSRSFEYSLNIGGSIFSILGELLTGKIGVKSMGGTFTTIAMTAEIAMNYGFYNLLQITAFIGVNLAVFNLLPVPALDGSRAVFVLIEWIFKKPVNRKVEAVIHTVGLAALLCFALFFDLQRCF